MLSKQNCINYKFLPPTLQQAYKWCKYILITMYLITTFLSFMLIIQSEFYGLTKFRRPLVNKIDSSNVQKY
jgi:hypothetical protein